MTLRAETLQLKNFRCFRDVMLELHPRLTVIVADNGMGKTALLDALCGGLAELVHCAARLKRAPGLLANDVRKQADQNTPAELRITVSDRGESVEWSLKRKPASSQMRRAPSAMKHMTALADRLARDSGDPETALPIVAYYRSTRLARDSYFGAIVWPKTDRLSGRLSGYREFARPLSTAESFNKWFERQWNAVRDLPATGTDVTQSALASLSTVRQAVAEVLGPVAWTSIDWDPQLRAVAMEHRDGRRLPMSWLSSGIRSMVALTADLAHRCARLNPQMRSEAATLTPGVVLIDEVDLHLHPAWQQPVVELLQRAFPQVQFVLTTHSPQVLSTVYSQSVRIVKHVDDQSFIVRPTFQTRGVESADVLAAIMGVDPIPRVKEAEELQRFRALIEDGQTEQPEIAALRRHLLEHFGEQHPVMLDCARLERFVAFKHRRKQEGGGDAQT
jgi:predicted ATP-binding protein involved in virulence